MSASHGAVAQAKALVLAAKGITRTQQQRLANEYKQLYSACCRHDIGFVKAFLLCGFNTGTLVNFEPLDGKLAICQAAISFVPELVSILLAYGAKVDVNMGGWNPLHMTVQYEALFRDRPTDTESLLAIVQMLLSLDTPIINQISSRKLGKVTPLYCCTRGQSVKLLLDCGADTSIRNSKQEPLLHYYVDRNRYTCVKVLLDHCNTFHSPDRPDKVTFIIEKGLVPPTKMSKKMAGHLLSNDELDPSAYGQDLRESFATVWANASKADRIAKAAAAFSTATSNIATGDLPLLNRDQKSDKVLALIPDQKSDKVLALIPEQKSDKVLALIPGVLPEIERPRRLEDPFEYQPSTAVGVPEKQIVLANLEADSESKVDLTPPITSVLLTKYPMFRHPMPIPPTCAEWFSYIDPESGLTTLATARKHRNQPLVALLEAYGADPEISATAGHGNIVIGLDRNHFVETTLISDFSADYDDENLNEDTDTLAWRLTLCAQGICRKPGRHKCGKCQQALYCSAECQQKAWSQHKLKCAKLRLKADEHQDVSVSDTMKLIENTSI